MGTDAEDWISTSIDSFAVIRINSRGPYKQASSHIRHDIERRHTGGGISFSVGDKLLIARKLDELGVDYIEGGWPGSNVKDTGFFARARECRFGHARLTAFGSTCHPRNRVEDDLNLQALLEAETPVVTIFGKTWDLHVRKALGISLEKNLELITASVACLKSRGSEVIYDAEHFFDGYVSDPGYAIETLLAAERGGSDWIVLCDTNGGTITSCLANVVRQVKHAITVPIGIHAHNDSDMAVANSIAAVECGANQVQGTINGYGERCGNANLCSVIPALELKLGCQTIARERLTQLTGLSRCVAELANLPHRSDMPFVGRSAFAHKGGIQVSAVMRDPSTYEHIDPEITGNSRRVLVSELSGKSTVLYKAAEMGIDVSHSSRELRRVVNRIKQLEHEGLQLEAAEASFRLLLEGAMGTYHEFFRLERYRVVTERNSAGDVKSQATVCLLLDGKISEATADGPGPVQALEHALRDSLSDAFESLASVQLTDYKVRVLDADGASAARVRVLIQSQDNDQSWSTVGVSDNIIDASWQALVDAINYKLLRTHGGLEKAASLG